MKSATAITAFLASFMVAHDTSVNADCLTDGGYAVPGTPCVSGCSFFTQDLSTPYVGINSPPSDPINVDGKMWCSTVEKYNPLDSTLRKSWGYCDCPTLAPTDWESHEVYMADGGGVATPTPCVLGARIRADNGVDYFFGETCEPITSVVPFVGFQLNSPVNNSTDKTMWCPTTDNYNTRKNAVLAQQKFLWGYCYKTQTTHTPTISGPGSDPTVAPSVPSTEPVTFSPSFVITMQPTTSVTLTPTDSFLEPTLTPTASPFSEDIQTSTPTTISIEIPVEYEYNGSLPDDSDHNNTDPEYEPGNETDTDPTDAPIDGPGTSKDSSATSIKQHELVIVSLVILVTISVLL